ncbi:MAG: YbaK/EbsC family protein [Nostoc sp.]|uniref:YbaK/EbsC family protein n=1 Tax=Nostoc sp. TaxID=1180 RepID=UPI002FF9E171
MRGFRGISKGQAYTKKLFKQPLKEVQPLTGYIRGGVTALASKKDYPVYLDETATLFEQITVSGGMRGMLLLLSPDDYLRAANGTLGAIVQN